MNNSPAYKVRMLDDAKLIRKRSQRKKWLIGALLLLVVWSLIAWWGARWLIVNAPLQHADVIVVLSGSRAYMERTQRAAQLYKEGFSRTVILTNDNQQGGWSTNEERNPFFYERARDELLRQGLPLSAIRTIRQPVYSTYEEAVLLRDYAEGNHLQSILVVTSAYHSRRALWTFRRVFAGLGKEIGIQSAPTGYQTPSPAIWWLSPKGWQVVAVEYVKLVYYWLSYRNP